MKAISGNGSSLAILSVKVLIFAIQAGMEFNKSLLSCINLHAFLVLVLAVV